MTTQLMYVPLPSNIEMQFRETFSKELETMSLEKFAEDSVKLLFEWENHPTLQMRRIAKYLSTIHTKDELSEIMTRHMATILGSSATENNSPDGQIDGQQAGAGVAVAVLGVAIAVWLIGWAITGECDWYMGAYSS